MHAKTDSEVTSLAPSSPPRSPPAGGGGGGGRPIYYVMSPSHPDVEKLSLGGSSPGGSPLHPHRYHMHHYYASSPFHHSRESSTTRLSASLKHHQTHAWRKLQQQHPSHHPSPSSHRSGAGTASDDDSDCGADAPLPPRCYVALFVLGFALLFSLFSLILWGASRAYKPQVTIKNVVFESYNLQAGMDGSGVPTKMLSIRSTVRIAFRNPATFFGVHVSATPLDLYYYDLRIASGQMKEFYESRKSGRVVTTAVVGAQVPLYGGGSSLTSRTEDGAPAVVPVVLTFTVRARAHVLGHLVKSKFYRHVRCSLYLHESRLGKPINVKNACHYHD